MSNVIVMGGSGGLGRQVISRLITTSNNECRWVNFSQDTGVDFRIRRSIGVAAESLSGDVSGIINCAGVNVLMPFDDVDAAIIENSFRANALALPTLVQVLRSLDKLRAGAAICNVISNAAHIPMTHSFAYNVSKAAQEMATKQMARELKEYCIFGVNPNKLEGTPMSREIEAQVLKLRGWTAEEAKRYQLAALPAGAETPPAALARFIVELMNPVHHPFITGCIFPYGGPQ